jgi:hypothetical protein
VSFDVLIEKGFLFNRDRVAFDLYPNYQHNYDFLMDTYCHTGPRARCRGPTGPVIKGFCEKGPYTNADITTVIS